MRSNVSYTGITMEFGGASFAGNDQGLFYFDSSLDPAEGLYVEPPAGAGNNEVEWEKFTGLYLKFSHPVVMNF